MSESIDQFGADLAFEIYKERELEEYNKQKEQSEGNEVVQNEMESLKKQIEHRDECIQTLKTFYDNLCNEVLRKQEQTDKDYAHWNEVDGQYKQHIEELNEYINKLKLLNMSISASSQQSGNNDNAAAMEQASNALNQLNEDNQIIVNALNSTKQDWKRKHDEMKQRLIETLDLVNAIQESYSFLQRENERLREEIKTRGHTDEQDENSKDMEIARLKEELNEVEERSAELEAYLTEEYQNLATEYATMKQEMKQNSSALQSTAGAATDEKYQQLLQQFNEYKEDSHNELQKVIETENEKYSLLKIAYEDAVKQQKQSSAASEEMESLQSKYDELSEAMSALKLENELLLNEKEHALQEQETEQRNAEALKQEIETLVGAMDRNENDYKQKLDALRMQNAECLREIEHWKKQTEEAKQTVPCHECDRYREEIHKYQATSAAQQRQIEQHITNAKQKEEQIGDLRASVEEKENRICHLEQDRESTICSKLEVMKSTAMEQERLRSIIKLLQNQINSLHQQNRTKIEKHAVGVLGPLSYHLVDVCASQLPINQ